MRQMPVPNAWGPEEEKKGGVEEKPQGTTSGGAVILTYTPQFCSSEHMPGILLGTWECKAGLQFPTGVASRVWMPRNMAVLPGPGVRSPQRVRSAVS